MSAIYAGPVFGETSMLIKPLFVYDKPLFIDLASGGKFYQLSLW
ncbi:MAG TPA: hypothetical protein VD993_13770 [Chitinophagaceae bacterium]|nr:hypothetical protein [Chitinophagaceae bacterium]